MEGSDPWGPGLAVHACTQPPTSYAKYALGMLCAPDCGERSLQIYQEQKVVLRLDLAGGAPKGRCEGRGRHFCQSWKRGGALGRELSQSQPLPAISALQGRMEGPAMISFLPESPPGGCGQRECQMAGEGPVGPRRKLPSSPGAWGVGRVQGPQGLRVVGADVPGQAEHGGAD